MPTKKKLTRRRNPAKPLIHAETQASIAKEPKIVDCWKCGGSGQYLNLGACFQCGGSGRMKAGAARVVGFIARERALQTLRDIYDATKRPRKATEHMDLGAPGCEALPYITEAMESLLAHGDVDTARKVFSAFSALPNGSYYAFHLAFGPSELRTWAKYPGNAQRLILALAERSAPWTRDRGDKVIEVKRFGFNG